MTKRKATACAAVLAGLAGWITTADAQDKVVLATATDLSGTYSDIAGNSSVLAIKMAIEDFGGSVLGKPIEYIVADHQNKPDISSALVREWVSQKKIDALVDVTLTPAARAAQQVANEKSIISLFSGSASLGLINEGCSPISFVWTYDTYTMPRGVGYGMKPGEKWFLITVNYAFGKQMEENLAATIKDRGGQLVGSVSYPLGTNDYSSYLLTAAASGANVIAFISAGSDLMNLIKQSSEFGLPRAGQRLATPLLFDNEVAVLGLQAAAGLQATLGFYWDHSPESRAFGERFKARYGKMPNMLNSGAYSMTLHYLKAVQAAGTTEARAVADKMRELPIKDFFAVNGHIRPDGRMVHDMFVGQVKTPAESTGESDVFKILQTIPGDEVAFPLEQSTCKLVKN
ncbi:ABC transporter substrate-binding protein [Pinisolibacter aquiterrae]|uniref:ABC transporter substrate-binding protein n=1 Tax=Pinisolibacter aquiterrae TaxID=2815579 RepID=UPI001C3DD72A|nr:ABC transporter substrate-binding protein [Pinisolibacter aquiterrae]MBV5266879.1 ABC transporter substrate-binding protein [Pinisolibacter aquiterrae]MCC8234810.1 ABC transporter substrate-binding protein [Pinisolibacter aquiterrae]